MKSSNGSSCSSGSSCPRACLALMARMRFCLWLDFFLGKRGEGRGGQHESLVQFTAKMKERIPPLFPLLPQKNISPTKKIKLITLRNQAPSCSTIAPMGVFRCLSWTWYSGDSRSGEREREVWVRFCTSTCLQLRRKNHYLIASSITNDDKKCSSVRGTSHFKQFAHTGIHFLLH